MKTKIIMGLWGCLLMATFAADGWTLPRSYLQVAGGANFLNTNLKGDVVDSRAVGDLELGLGTHLNDNWLIEAVVGRFGTQQQDGRIRRITDLEDLLLSEKETTYRVDANPVLLRAIYTPGGFRRGYVKPEFSFGLGVMSVTRRLRPVFGLPPRVLSDLLPAAEIGISALMVIGPNFLGYFGPRYLFMQRRDLVDDTRHLDGVSFLLGFRFFLNSPREESIQDEE